jgi:hypothetical protein
LPVLLVPETVLWSSVSKAAIRNLHTKETCFALEGVERRAAEGKKNAEREARRDLSIMPESAIKVKEKKTQ